MDFFVDGFFEIFKYILRNSVDFLNKFIWGYSRLSIALFISYAVVGFFLYLFYTRKTSGKKVNYFKFLFPKVMYTHPSAIMDYKTKLLKIVLRPAKLLILPISYIMVSTATLKFLTYFYKVPWEKFEPSGFILFIIGFAGFMANDFVEYINHKFAHEIRIYWEIHAVHHSAEVLNPITSRRHHPLFGLITSFINIFVMGITQGVLVWLLVKNLEFSLLLSLNYVILFFNVIGGGFRHSHVWFSFGWLDKILISPAMHQIHHSSDPKHRNKNYGLWLTCWDYMFGTLYIPKGKEELNFGLDVGVKNPHDTLFNFFFGPLIEIGKIIGEKFQGKPKKRRYKIAQTYRRRA